MPLISSLARESLFTCRRERTVSLWRRPGLHNLLPAPPGLLGQVGTAKKVLASLSPRPVGGLIYLDNFHSHSHPDDQLRHLQPFDWCAAYFKFAERCLVNRYFRLSCTSFNPPQIS